MTMKRLFNLVTVFALILGFSACQKEIVDYDSGVSDKVSLMDGAIVINNNPKVKIDEKNQITDGVEASSGGLKSSIEVKSVGEPAANNYRFRLVAQMGALEVESNGRKYKAQATHVKISDDGYVFVSYNHKGEPNVGGLVIYRYTLSKGKFMTTKVNLRAVSSIEMPMAQINAIDFDGNNLYLAGANQDPRLGYRRGNPAFFMVMELDGRNKFKPVEPSVIKQLTSFQATSIRKYNDKIYVTTGDGTEGTKGGLYIFNAADYSEVNFIQKEHARSVDVDASGVYLMQANHARISKYNFDGTGGVNIYDAPGEAMQRDAKSEILAWDKYIFSAQNESGLRMIDKAGNLNASLARPGADPENDVTNSVSMNGDIKRTVSGKEIQSNLLLLANGGKGVYWYDVMNDAGKDKIVSSRRNSILGGTGSANFITSKGNIVFVADGLGGLKVLYIGIYTDLDKKPDKDNGGDDDGDDDGGDGDGDSNGDGNGDGDIDYNDYEDGSDDGDNCHYTIGDVFIIKGNILNNGKEPAYHKYLTGFSSTWNSTYGSSNNLVVIHVVNECEFAEGKKYFAFVIANGATGLREYATPYGNVVINHRNRSEDVAFIDAAWK